MKFNKLILIISSFLVFTNLIAEEEVETFNPNLPAQISEANAEFVYKFLLAEIALQRNDPNAAGHLYLDLAKLTKNSLLAQNAAQLGSMVRNGRLALDAADVWSKLDPKSADAQKVLAEMYIASGNLAKARPIVKKILESEESKGDGFLYLNNILSRVENKTNALRFIVDIAKPYPNMVEAHFAVAHTAHMAGNETIRDRELKIVDSLDPKWETSILFKGAILFQQDPNQAIDEYKKFINKNPKSNSVRLELAKALVQTEKYAEAKQHFEQLVNSPLASSDLSLTVALLALESGDDLVAEKYLKQALERKHPNPDQIYMYLARIYAQREDLANVLNWVEKISAGPMFVDSRIFAAQSIRAKNGVSDAINYLDQFKSLDRQEKLKFLQLKTSFLYNDNQYQQAINLMLSEEEKYNDSAEFYFDFGLLYEKNKDFESMEKHLKKAISLKPDYAIAYNALGYSYADRNIKLDDAKKYIEIALSIDPQNHYILDSMGWVYFRLGNYDIAYEFITKAYTIQEDPEIAAHLGEVLWKQGKQNEAISIWQSSLEKFPENLILIETKNRLFQ
ncbi:MAG: tetratricopeptide repeat protein [Methylophilaceae bacterium]|jgi:tetratricopeptide (TPR) repeat protein